MVAAESSQNPRQRRCRNDSAKHYDAERKDLQLEEVWAVLQTYGDYDGGINCSICGKIRFCQTFQFNGVVDNYVN